MLVSVNIIFFLDGKCHPPIYIPHFGKVCALQNIVSHVDGGMSDYIKHAETQGARTTIAILFHLLKISSIYTHLRYPGKLVKLTLMASEGVINKTEKVT